MHVLYLNVLYSLHCPLLALLMAYLRHASDNMKDVYALTSAKTHTSSSLTLTFHPYYCTVIKKKLWCISKMLWSPAPSLEQV